MPAVYTYDRTTPQESAGKYSGRPTPNVTAFNSSAPKPLVKVLEPHIPQGIQKIPPPHNRDDSFGQVTASFVHKTIRATPFNNKLKGNPKEQFKSPSYGKVGKQSTDTVSTFANRVKRVIEYLRALQRPDMEDIFKSLIALYVSDRLPNKKELEQIDAVEKLIFQYNIVPPPAPLRVEIPPEPQYMEDATPTPIPSPIDVDLGDTMKSVHIEGSPPAQTVPTAIPVTPFKTMPFEYVTTPKPRPPQAPHVETARTKMLIDSLRKKIGFSSSEEEVASEEEKHEQKHEQKHERTESIDMDTIYKIQNYIDQGKTRPQQMPGITKEDLAGFYNHKIENFKKIKDRLPSKKEAKEWGIPYDRVSQYRKGGI